MIIIRDVVARLGLADVAAFGLTWESVLKSSNSQSQIQMADSPARLRYVLPTEQLTAKPPPACVSGHFLL